MVIQSKTPKKRCVRQIQMPPTQIQITFMITDRQPPLLPLSMTSCPKGQQGQFQGLEREGYADDGDAEQKARYEIFDEYQYSTEYQPDDVS